MRNAIVVFAGVVTLGLAFAAQAQYYGPQPYPPSQPLPPRGQVVQCNSVNQNVNRCYAPWRDVRIVRQLSSAPCVQGQTWGFDRGYIWVARGCRAEFTATAYYGGWYPQPDWNQRFVVGCGSSRHQYGFCQVDVGRHGRVYIQRQTSNAACIEGQTWGWNRAGIWVDRGCGAQFMVDRRW